MDIDANSSRSLIGPIDAGLTWALSSKRLTPRTAQVTATNRPYVIYYRVSTPQQGRSGLGLEAQRTAVERFLGKSLDQAIKVYTEIESGKRCGRPKLREALGACRALGATLLVAQLDRLARNVTFL